MARKILEFSQLHNFLEQHPSWQEDVKAFLALEETIPSLEESDLAAAENIHSASGNVLIYASDVFAIEGILLFDATALKALLLATCERAVHDLLRTFYGSEEVSADVCVITPKDLQNAYAPILTFYQTYARDMACLKKSPVSSLPISSKKQEIVGEFRDLSQLSQRLKQGKFLCEGELLVKRALKDHLPVEKIVVSQSLDEVFLKELKDLAGDIPLYTATPAMMAVMSNTHPTPQVLCSVRCLLQDEEGLSVENPHGHFILIADGIANPDNLGMLLRTADAAGASAVILLSNSTHYLNKNAIRGARGAIGRLPIYFAADDLALLAKLKENSFQILGTSARFEAANFFDVSYEKNCAVIIGNESVGVRKEILDACTGYVKIPMAAGQSSLNIAVAAALMVYKHPGCQGR